MSSTVWLQHDPNPFAKHHLVCLPYSGAPASLFNHWRIPGVDVLPLILPGRGPRRNESPGQPLLALAADIIDDVISRIPGPYSLLGHSMGAWLAHAVATLLAERGAPGPERLLVLSAPPPHLPARKFSSMHDLPDDDFVDELINLGAAPVSSREAVRSNLELTRAHATAVAGYQPTGQLLSCPITAIGGDRDPMFPLNDLTVWRETTHANVSVHVVKAGHFTVTEQAEEVIHIAAHETLATTRHIDPIAVIGMGCRFPGASNYTEFWDLISEGGSAVGPIPADRATNSRDPVISAGGFIDGVDLFDAEHFGFSVHEARRSDPRVRLLLMTTQEAIDDAGLTAQDVAGPRTGIWVGEMHSDYFDLAASHPPPLDMYGISGGALKTFLAGRVSHFYDLRGPSITVDTACSASLTAIHSACQALRHGDVDTAFAAGAHLLLNPDGPLSRGLAKALSKHGRCAFASVDADGFARAEGVAVVMLKRLSDAVRDKDPIHAVIEGSAINANGQSGHGNIVATSAPGQVAMMRLALADAGRHPSDIGYVEAHGTGTKVGDSVELTAVHDVYGANPHPCLVGSVKTNIGHPEPSAGIAGLIKTVLALKHQQVPASLNHKAPIAAIDWDKSAIRVPTRLETWPMAGRRPRAAVSSFGLGGANAHVVLAAASQGHRTRPRLPQRSWNLQRYWYTDLARRG